MLRRRPHTVALLAAAVLGVGVPRAARAEEQAPLQGLPAQVPDPSPPPSQVEELLDGLGKPARPEVVRRILTFSEVRRTDCALMVVRALTAAGGVAATEGLLALAGHRDAQVRAWALRGVDELGLRASRGVEEVRRALESADDLVRHMACDALGVVGDARDVPVLLGIAQDPADRSAGHALQAVRRLGGLKGARWRSVGRVRSWWEGSRERLRRETDEALAAIEAGTSAGALPMHHAMLRRAAWFDPEAVVERVRGWLGHEDPRLRLEGYRVVAGLRLGDMAEATAAALRYESDEACLREGGLAVDAVGFPIPTDVRERIRRAGAVLAAPPGDGPPGDGPSGDGPPGDAPPTEDPAPAAEPAPEPAPGSR